jgi:hypothetical protein
MIKLTIGICSVPQRADDLAKLLTVLMPQLTDEVELIIITDNQQRSLGQKRKDISEMAKGRMLSFIDDDDRISNDYVQSILSAPKAHIIAFDAIVTVDNSMPLLCDFDVNHEHEVNEPHYLRWPNQLCAIDTRVVKAVGWRDIFKEDFDFALRLKNYYLANELKQVKLNKVLYYYDYDSTNTLFK